MVNLIIISPHPDDESIYCGGLIARASSRGIPVSCVFITSGKHGRTLGLVDSENLAQKRISEASKALEILGVNDVTTLGFDDYDPASNTLPDWADVHDSLMNAIASEINNQTILLTMPANGMNGHPDHVHTSDIVTKIARETNCSLWNISSEEVPEYPEKLGFLPLSVRSELKDDPNYILYLSREEIQRKLAALACYETQALSVLGHLKRSAGGVSEEFYSTNFSQQLDYKVVADILGLEKLQKPVVIAPSFPTEDALFIDVMQRSEVPPPPKGLRYFDMIGGTKNIRMFLAPEHMLRAEFMRQNEHALDEGLKPIFACEGITVRQDMAYAVPGFYIISPTASYSSIDEMPILEQLRLANVKYWVRKGMRETLGIEHVHVYYEEPEGIRHSHEWILPIFNITAAKRIYDLNVNDYLESYRFSEQRGTIMDYNTRMRQYLVDIQLVDRDRELVRSFKNGQMINPNVGPM